MTRLKEKLRAERDMLRIVMSGVHTRDDVEHEQAVREQTTRAVQLILDALIDGVSEDK